MTFQLIQPRVSRCARDRVVVTSKERRARVSFNAALHVKMGAPKRIEIAYDHSNGRLFMFAARSESSGYACAIPNDSSRSVQFMRPEGLDEFRGRRCAYAESQERIDGEAVNGVLIHTRV